jgi:hypothetical protein
VLLDLQTLLFIQNKRRTTHDTRHQLVRVQSTSYQGCSDLDCRDWSVCPWCHAAQSPSQNGSQSFVLRSCRIMTKAVVVTCFSFSASLAAWLNDATRFCRKRNPEERRFHRVYPMQAHQLHIISKKLVGLERPAAVWNWAVGLCFDPDAPPMEQQSARTISEWKHWFFWVSSLIRPPQRFVHDQWCAYVSTTYSFTPEFDSLAIVLPASRTCQTSRTSTRMRGRLNRCPRQ